MKLNLALVCKKKWITIVPLSNFFILRKVTWAFLYDHDITDDFTLGLPVSAHVKLIALADFCHFHCFASLQLTPSIYSRGR